jgi:hypothetical protein
VHLVTAIEKRLNFFIRQGPPPFIFVQGAVINVRIVDPSSEWKRPLARRYELSNGDAVPRDEDFFPFEHGIEEPRELRLRIMDVVAGHVFKLVHFWD